MMNYIKIDQDQSDNSRYSPSNPSSNIRLLNANSSKLPQKPHHDRDDSNNFLLPPASNSSFLSKLTQKPKNTTKFFFPNKNINPNNNDTSKLKNLTTNSLSNNSFDLPDPRQLRKVEKICDSDSEDDDTDDEKDNGFIIMPENPYKTIWDLIIAFIIIYSSIVLPYKLAFDDNESTSDQIVDSILSIFLLVDIVLNFFSVYIDKDDNVIKNKKKIIKHYLQTWFAIDVISVIPFNYLTSKESYNPYSTIARLSRLPRIYQLIRLFKLIRMVKILKNNNSNSVSKFFLDLIKISPNIERLIYFIFAFMLLNHIAACIWYYVAKLQDLNPDCWVTRLGYIDATHSEIYIVSFYWTLTTVTTVGYGDINAGTTIERIYNLFLMLFGVIMYSFAIGSLSSIVSTLDNKTAEMNQKLNILSSIKREFNLDQEIYDKVRKVIKYDLSRNQKDKMDFLQELPNKLRIELSHIMHDSVISKMYFFKGQPNDFIAYVAPLLKPVKFSQNDYLYKCNDIIDEMYFVSKGTIIFCLSKDYNEKELKEVKKHNNFGEIEMCLNEKLTYNIKVKSRSSELFVLKKNDFLKLSVNFKDFIEKFLQKSLLIYLRFTEEKTKIVTELDELKKIQNEIRGLANPKQQILEQIEEKEENSMIDDVLIDSEDSQSLSSEKDNISEDDEDDEDSEYQSEKDSKNSKDSLNKDKVKVKEVVEDKKPQNVLPKSSEKAEHSKQKRNTMADFTKLTPLSLLNNESDDKSGGIIKLKKINTINTKQFSLLDDISPKDNKVNNDSNENLKSQINQKFVKKVNKIIDFLEKNKIELGKKEDNTLGLLKKLATMTNLTERNELIEKLEGIVDAAFKKEIIN